ncbi:DUF805 domain-containing protein [Demequina activiva]|uniref:DUF805 domain-containing protein n=1 Tax=Demequina activiva TaxID=1582364 RepID=A0A919UFT4_9MICO|nr:DUF805 domain-containing protein [Demequina activiva]GIG54072.1 hypothetical protein Dac01nite_08240 [Demequina activiva]
MGFTDAVRHSFRNFATFEGRARRSEFWFFYLFLSLAGLAGGAIVLVVALLTIGLSSAGDGEPSGVAIAIYLVVIALWFLGMLVLYLPFLAVWARRLHDMGQTGHWLWLNLVSLGIVPGIMAFMDSEPGPNRWGPDPKAAERPAVPYGYAQAGYGAPAGYAGAQPGQIPPGSAPAPHQPGQVTPPPPPPPTGDNPWAQPSPEPPAQPDEQR